MSRELSAYIRRITADGASLLGESVRRWCAGVESERFFWSRWFETKGLEWPEDYQHRLVERALPEWLLTLLPRDRPAARVLDVGSGPLSKIGTIVPSGTVEVVAVDPLANVYADLIAKHLDAQPPVQTRFSFAEDLSCRFEPDSFDVINCTNALDHSIAPMWGLVEMLLVLRLGGSIFLSHRRNEAEFERYEGFHQWNFDRGASDQDLVFWNRSQIISVTDMLSGFCSIEHRTSVDDEYLTTVVTKTDHVPFDPSRYQRLMRGSVLELVLSQFAMPKPSGS